MHAHATCLSESQGKGIMQTFVWTQPAQWSDSSGGPPALPQSCTHLHRRFASANPLHAMTGLGLLPKVLQASAKRNELNIEVRVMAVCLSWVLQANTERSL